MRDFDWMRLFAILNGKVVNGFIEILRKALVVLNFLVRFFLTFSNRILFVRQKFVRSSDRTRFF